MITSKIEIESFNYEFKDYFEGIESILMTENGHYYTILYDRKKAGIVGYIPAKNDSSSGFIQITLNKKYRGLKQDIVCISEDLVAIKHNLKTLYATIQIDNIASIKAHKKANYKELDDNEIRRLREAKSLKENQIRLIKKYV